MDGDHEYLRSSYIFPFYYKISFNESTWFCLQRNPEVGVFTSILIDTGERRVPTNENMETQIPSTYNVDSIKDIISHMYLDLRVSQ